MKKFLRYLFAVSVSINVMFLLALMWFLFDYYVVLPKNAEMYMAAVSRVMGRTLEDDAITPVFSWGGVEFFGLDANQGVYLARLDNESMSAIAYVSDDIAGVVVGESGFELSNGQGGNIMKVCLIGGNDTQYSFK